MTEPQTEAGKSLAAIHAESKSWPSQRNDPDAQADGYLHYCAQCLGRTYPCHVMAALARIEAESRNATLDEVVRVVEGLPQYSLPRTAARFIVCAAVLKAVKALRSSPARQLQRYSLIPAGDEPAYLELDPDGPWVLYRDVAHE